MFFGQRHVGCPLVAVTSVAHSVPTTRPKLFYEPNNGASNTRLPIDFLEKPTTFGFAMLIKADNFPHALDMHHHVVVLCKIVAVLSNSTRRASKCTPTWQAISGRVSSVDAIQPATQLLWEWNDVVHEQECDMFGAVHVVSSCDSESRDVARCLLSVVRASLQKQQIQPELTSTLVGVLPRTTSCNHNVVTANDLIFTNPALCAMPCEATESR